jgi:hypothetical protein
MATKFISHVQEDGVGGWYIKLTDTFDNKEVICKDLDEYKVKIEEMGDDYGHDIEVVWTRSPKLTPANIQEIQEGMAEFQKEYQSEINELTNQTTQNNGGISSND